MQGYMPPAGRQQYNAPLRSSSYHPPQPGMPMPPQQQQQRRRQNAQLMSSAPPQIISPTPTHAPTRVNTQSLQAQASEVGAVPPYHPPGRQSSSYATGPGTASLSATTPANMSLDYNRRQSSLPPPQQSHAQQSQQQGLSTSGFMPSASASRHSLLPSNMPNIPQRPHSTGPSMSNSQVRASSSSRPGSSLGSSSSTGPSAGGRLARSLPTAEELHVLRNLAQDPQAKVSWAKSIFKFLERNQTDSTISDPNMVSNVDEAVRTVLHFAGTMPPVPEAVYIKADLTMTGTFPTILPKNPKLAFRDFESAANAEFAPAWYRIGREYETFNDLNRAKDAYERGMKLGDVTSTYRLGMAYLLGQLGLQPDINKGLDNLKTAAMIADQVADPDLAAPLYVWAMILAGEFEAPNVAPEALPREPAEAGRYMQKAAYLCHSTAQFKMGWAHEHAQLGYAFDPFMSVQYYSLASQQGDAEADMALSKWFLCGAEKCFSANEDLAWTFADKAARKGLATAEFALGYYSELGIGAPANVDVALSWYEKAASQGNEDAVGRIEALRAEGHGMSRAEHETHTAKLQRTRTQAKARSDTIRRPAGEAPSQGEVQRKTTMRRAQQAAGGDYNPAASTSSQRPYPPPQQQLSQSPPSTVSSPANLGPPRAGPEMKRFTLTDAPPAPGSMPPPSRPQPQRPPPQQQQAPVPVNTAAQKEKGPETFEQMGIQTTTMKKDDCIIC